MNNEDLYRQMVEQEREDDLRYQQSLAAKNVKVARREPDAMKAIARYNRDFKPVFEARQRVRNGRGPTGNPIKDAWLKMTGQIKLPEAAPEEIIAPNNGFALSGKTIAEVQKEIADNPDKYADLRRAAPKVSPVAAERKKSSDLHRE